MNKKEPIQVKDLLEDPQFREWAKGEDGPGFQKWEYRYVFSTEDREAMDEARILLEGIPFKQRFLSDKSVDLAWEKLEASLDQRSAVVSQESRRRSVFVLKIAAAVLLLLAAGAGLFSIYQNSEVVYRTPYGERMHIELSDGSRVFLNANSSLSYIRKDPRTVRIEGEGYFYVAKKPRTGEFFIVNTPDLTIRVLGTEFNVNSRNQRTEVLLDEGSVELDLADLGKMLMEPGDLISFSAVDERILEQKIPDKPEVITSWKQGVLLLDSITLNETLKLLEETYNVTTLLENEEVGKKVLVGGVPNDNLESCIQALKTIYKLDIQLNENQLTIK